MSLFPFRQNVWDADRLLYDTIDSPTRQASPYFFILGRNATLNETLRGNHHLFLEVGAYHTLEISLARLMSAPPDFALCLTTRSAYYSGMARAMALVLNERFGVPNHKSLQIETCLQEAIMNAIVHGNLGLESNFSGPRAMDAYFAQIKSHLEEPAYRCKRISVTVSQSNSYITLGVCDQGNGFTLPDRRIEHTLPHGRGVILIKSLADSVWVEKDRRTIFMTFKC